MGFLVENEQISKFSVCFSSFLEGVYRIEEETEKFADF